MIRRYKFNMIMVVQWKSDGILSFIADQLTTISPLLNNEAHPTINPPILTSGLVIWEIASVSAQVRETDSHHKLVGWSELSPPLLVPRCARKLLWKHGFASLIEYLSTRSWASDHIRPPALFMGWSLEMMGKHDEKNMFDQNGTSGLVNFGQPGQG